MEQKIVPANIFEKMEKEASEKNNEILELKNKVNFCDSTSTRESSSSLTF